MFVHSLAILLAVKNAFGHPFQNQDTGGTDPGKDYLSKNFTCTGRVQAAGQKQKSVGVE